MEYIRFRSPKQLSAVENVKTSINLFETSYDGFQVFVKLNGIWLLIIKILNLHQNDNFSVQNQKEYC